MRNLMVIDHVNMGDVVYIHRVDEGVNLLLLNVLCDITKNPRITLSTGTTVIPDTDNFTYEIPSSVWAGDGTFTITVSDNTGSETFTIAKATNTSVNISLQKTGSYTYSLGTYVNLLDISENTVDTITAQSEEYPDVIAGNKMSTIIGKIKKFLNDLKSKKVDKAGDTMTGKLQANGGISSSGFTASKILTTDANKNIISSSYEFDISTNNTSDTWLLVMNNGKIQHRVSTDLSVASATNATNATYINPLATGRASNPNDGNSIVIFKRVTSSEAPNNGVILEFGNSASWRGQLYIGDNATQGIAWNGWSNGTRGSWLTFLNSGNYTSLIKSTLDLNAGQMYRIGSRCALSDLGTTAGAVLGNNGVFARSYSNTNNYVNMYAAGFSQQSSRLVKENINPITDEEAKKLLDIDVVSFDYIEEVGGQKDNVGMIAEDMLDIYPNLVQIPEGYSEEKALESIYEGNNTETLALDYAKFTPYLIKMVQMQQKQIEDMQKQIDELKKLIKGR